MKRKNRFNSSFLGIINGNLKYPYMAVILTGFFIWFAFMLYWQIENNYPLSVTIAEIKDFKLEERTGNLSSMVAFFVGYTIVSLLLGNCNDKNKSKNEVVKNSVNEILPIRDEEYILGSCISSSIIMFVTLGIPYLTMLFYRDIHPALIGVRGVILTSIILICAVFTLLNISEYKKNIKWKVKVIIYIFFGLGASIYLISKLSGTNKIVQMLSHMEVELYSSSIFNFIGSTYVFTIAGVILVACFYYFNYVYILKGVKELGWKVER